MNNIIDAEQRALALDPSQSFIVQAPAGSGKTGILIQRLLTLLSHVTAPEQIIAVTFTRKAADEMRSRLILALHQAQNSEPEDPYQRMTWHLAKKALLQDQQQGWHLLDNPNRLRILTIDALCAKITRYAPLLSRFGADLSVLSDPQRCYQQAARCLLQSINQNVPWKNALQTLLLHLDNHQEWLEELFIQMLASRDQWLPFVVGHHGLGELRQSLETSLRHVLEDAINTCQTHLPSSIENALNELIEFAAANLELSIEFSDENRWRLITDILLNQKGEWRKSVSQNQGFPAAASTKNAAEKSLFQEMKRKMQALQEGLQDNTVFQSHLRELQMSPPTTYNDSQWSIVAALVDLLPILAAQLTLVFKEVGSVDFIEITQGALKALGTTDDPTAIALNLDYHIQHLLIDEFQDTSVTQFQLIELLTSGWEVNDGRSLFIVGDPMQSIYRFREAEVGLFIRAKNTGIGNIILNPLILRSNFRSDDNIVEWCNHTFEKIFPKEEDMIVGAIPYERATATQTNTLSRVTCHTLVDETSEQEAARILQVVQAYQSDNPEGKIVILARSRSHFSEIIPALERAELNYQAVDIASLAFSMVIQDLFALTRALTHLADRIAWLSVLRAPWCGLTLSDIHTLINPERSTVYDCLDCYEHSAISEDGKKRLSIIVPILKNAILNRGRQRLQDSVRHTWQQLNGPDCYAQKFRVNADQFFGVLDQLDEGSGDLVEISLLEKKLSQLFASPDPDADGRLQLMTIHRAKGLEFDCVIIPGLERRPASDSANLMLWQARPRPHHGTELILGPIKSSNEDSDPIYDYLRYQEKLKTQQEVARLLYVATTRAKHQLHLFGTVTKSEDNTFSSPALGSFLSLLWPHIQQEFSVEKRGLDISQKNTQKHQLIRLQSDQFSADSIYSTRIKQPTEEAQQISLPTAETVDNRVGREVGTILHQCLQKIAQIGLSKWQSLSQVTLEQQWENQLSTAGVESDNIPSAICMINNALSHVLRDQKAHWIFSTSHSDVHSEYPLSYFSNGEVHNIILDLTFIDSDGIRWIVDYKSTPCPEEIPLERFLEIEEHRHCEQLLKYAHAMRMLDNREIRAALYFPSIPAWREIPVEGELLGEH